MGLTQSRSRDGVMTTAVIPRRMPGDGRDESFGQRRRAIPVDGRQELHDLEVLAATAVGRQLGQAVGVDGQADGPVLLDGLVGDRGRRPDGDLHGRFVAPADLAGSVEVQDDPGVGGLLEVELLDLDVTVASRATSSGCG